MKSTTELSVQELWNGMLNHLKQNIICAYYNRIISGPVPVLGVNWRLWNGTPEWVYVSKKPLPERLDLAEQLLEWVRVNCESDFDKIQCEHFEVVLKHLHDDFCVYRRGLNTTEPASAIQFVAFAITQMENAIRTVETVRGCAVPT